MGLTDTQKAIDILTDYVERSTHWKEGGATRHDAKLALKAIAAQPVAGAVAEPSRSQKMREAGFTARDTRLTCDECGAKFTRQFAPLHECAAPEPSAQGRPCPFGCTTQEEHDAHQSAEPSAQAGWKLVPVEPTEAMLWRGHMKIDFNRSGQNTYELEHESQEGSTIRTDMLDAWAAMLAASPQPDPSAQGEPVAALMRSRHITTHAKDAVDMAYHFSEWGDWIPTTYKHAKAVTDPSRNSDPVLYEMQPLYASAPSTPPPSAQGEPVAWLRQDWSGSGPSSLSFDGPPDPKPVRDEVVNPVWTPLYASAPSTPPHAVVEAVPLTVTDEMVGRFLSWPLPDDFHPDGGVSFGHHVGTQDGVRARKDMGPGWWPVGTNLLTYTQAKAMLEHVLGIAPKAAQEKT